MPLTTPTARKGFRAATHRRTKIGEVFELFPALLRIARRAEAGRRITPAEVVEAFQSGGLIPCDSDGRTWDGREYCQHAGAVTALEALFSKPGDRRGRDPGQRRFLAVRRGVPRYSEAYLGGFSDGWEVDFHMEEFVNPTEGMSCWHPTYVVGRVDGDAARAAVSRWVRGL